MKNISKYLILFILLLAASFTLVINKINFNSASYPVEDGAIITAPNKIDTIHASYLLIKSENTFLFNDLSKEIKTRQISIIPSYIDRYFVEKVILSEENAAVLDFKISPKPFEDKYQIKYILNSAKFKNLSLGIENIAKNYSPKVSENSIVIPIEKCITKIVSKNKLLEIKNSIIWYDAHQGENIFEISFICND